MPCLYRDREQYFAERTRMLSGAGSAVRDASSKAQLSAINAFTPSSSRGSTPSQASTSSDRSSASSDRSDSPSYFSYLGVEYVGTTTPPFQPYTDTFDAQPGPSLWCVSSLVRANFIDVDVEPCRDATMPPLAWSPPRHSPDLHPERGQIHGGMGMAAPMNPLLGLFESGDSNQPHPSLMMNFIQEFFAKFGSTYPFLSSDVVYERFIHRRLPPLLANAIAACTARCAILLRLVTHLQTNPLNAVTRRFSTVPEIMQIGPANASDVYCQMAKVCILFAGPPQGMRL